MDIPVYKADKLWKDAQKSSKNKKLSTGMEYKMKRYVSLEEISDGRLYGLNDMVKADCNDCKGCSACCQGMGGSIVLDPMDVYRMEKGLSKSFEELLNENIELQVVDGIILPNLKMAGADERCSFLNKEGRCGIHAFRPGICRIFPLGRYYEGDSFQYFLQVHECKNTKRSKVKVHKWIDMPDAKRYDVYICEWHRLLMRLEELLVAAPEKAKEISMAVLVVFYQTPYDTEKDFYEQFEERLPVITTRFF